MIVVDRMNLKFDDLPLALKKAPFAAASENDPIDITCLDDEAYNFLPGACVENGDIKAEVFDYSPSIFYVGKRATLSLSWLTRDTATGETSGGEISLGDFTLTAVGAAKIESGGNRVVTNELTFTPSNY